MLLIAGAAAIFVYLIQRHAPNILKILESGNFDEMDEYLEKYGTAGKFLLVGLQTLETISIVLPSTPVYICAGVLFGKIKGIAVCYLTNLVLNVLIFLGAGKMQHLMHHSLDIKNHKFVGKLIENAKHMDRVVIAMCLLPIMPNGMIPYVSAQTEISLAEFTRALALGSLPAIAVYVCCGDILVSENYHVIIPVIIVLVVLVILGYVFRKKVLAFAEPRLKKLIEG